MLERRETWKEGGGGNICEATTLWKGSAACPPVCKPASCNTHTHTNVHLHMGSDAHTHTHNMSAHKEADERRHINEVQLIMAEGGWENSTTYSSWV